MYLTWLSSKEESTHSLLDADLVPDKGVSSSLRDLWSIQLRLAPLAVGDGRIQIKSVEWAGSFNNLFVGTVVFLRRKRVIDVVDVCNLNPSACWRGHRWKFRRRRASRIWSSWMMRQFVPTHRCTVEAGSSLISSPRPRPTIRQAVVAEVILVSVASVSDPPPHRLRFVSNRNVGWSSAWWEASISVSVRVGVGGVA